MDKTRLFKGQHIVLAALLALVACAEAPQQQRAAFDMKSLTFPREPEEPRFHFERSIRSSSDVTVQEKDEDSALMAFLTGERASDAGERMAKPYGVAVHQGRLFVSDSVRRVVLAFDIAEKKFFTVGESGDGAVRMPLGMDVDGAGNLYVADATPKFVRVYDRDGNFLRNIGGPKLFSRLASVAVDKEGTKVFAVDIGGSIVSAPETHRIRVFDAKTGEHLYDIGKRGAGDDEFNLPKDMVVGYDGLLYVVDSGNFRVKVLKQDGTFVRSFGKVGLRLGDFSRPKEIAVDKEGNIYVSDAAFGNFQIFNNQGQLLMFVGDRAETDAPAKYSLPAGIAVDEDGRVFMVDQVFRKVDVYRPAKLKFTEGYASPMRLQDTTAAKQQAVDTQASQPNPAVPEAKGAATAPSVPADEIK